MKLKPIADRVVIKALDANDKTASGILLPGKEKSVFATVVAVGSGTDKVKMEVKEGDKVIYTKFAGCEVEADGETYIILNQSDILAVCED